MEDNIFDKFGRATGYGQMAPGRDLPQTQNELARKRGVMQSAISGAPGGMPQGGTTTPFNGAKQTIGAATAAPSKRGIASAIQGASSGLGDVLGQMSRPQSQQQQNTGFLGGLMDNAQAQAPAQSPARNVGPLSPGATVAPAGPSGFAPSIAPGEPAPGQEFDRPADRQAPAYKVNLEGFGGMRADGRSESVV